MAFNPSELILDRVRSITTHALDTKKMLFRLTSLEDPSLQCTAEGEEITDAIGALITTLYRAKKATFSATNSLFSTDLAAAQYGTAKEVGTALSKIVDYTYDILTFTGAGGETVKLKHMPANKDDILWAYGLVNGETGTAYAAGATASATEFVVAADGTVTPPTGFTGKLYIEYTYEAENAIKISNKTSNFPEACSAIIYAYFRDKCNENLTYSGKIICPKAKLNPEQVELALTSTGKHAFEMQMMKDYCADEDDDELFAIIIASDSDAASSNPYVRLNKSNTSIAESASETLVVEKYPADATVTWTSTDTTVATVSDGVVSGVSAGNATIVATITSGGKTYNALCNVIVTAGE